MYNREMKTRLFSSKLHKCWEVTSWYNCKWAVVEYLTNGNSITYAGFSTEKEAMKFIGRKPEK